MRVRGDPAATVVCLDSRLDVTAAAEVRDMLDRALADGAGDLVVDLSWVELIDATGLGVLVGAHRKALHRQRRLILRDVPPRVMRLLARTRLYRTLRVEDSRPLAA